MLVYGQPLVGQGIDEGRFAGKRRIEEVPVGEPVGLGYGRNNLGGRRKIQAGGRAIVDDEIRFIDAVFLR